jgi:hypothetical protein
VIGEVWLYPNCVPIEGIQEHSRALRRRQPKPNVAREACISALLARTRDRSENPGVGGSIRIPQRVDYWRRSRADVGRDSTDSVLRQAENVARNVVQGMRPLCRGLNGQPNCLGVVIRDNAARLERHSCVALYGVAAARYDRRRREGRVCVADAHRAETPTENVVSRPSEAGFCQTALAEFMVQPDVYYAR